MRNTPKDLLKEILRRKSGFMKTKVFQQSDLDQGFTDGNESGVAYVEANPSEFNFLTDAEKMSAINEGLQI